MAEYFFQAEDGIRDVERSRGLGDVYKRQECGKCRVWKMRSVENAECGKCRTFEFQYEINK